MGFPVSVRLGKGGLLSCQSRWIGARPSQNCNSPLRKERDVSYSDVRETGEKTQPTLKHECVKACESLSSEAGTRQIHLPLLVG